MSSLAVIKLHCAFCHDGLVARETTYCAACLAPHHQGCFEEHGRCSALGCGSTSLVRGRELAPRPTLVTRLDEHRGFVTGAAIALAIAMAVGLRPTMPVPAPAPIRVDQAVGGPILATEDLVVPVDPGARLLLEHDPRDRVLRVTDETRRLVILVVSEGGKLSLREGGTWHALPAAPGKSLRVHVGGRREGPTEIYRGE